MRNEKTNNFEDCFSSCITVKLKASYKFVQMYVFNRRNTSIQVWIYMAMSKWWQNFNLRVNYSCKCYIIED